MISLATNLAEVPLHRPASLKKSISSHVPDGTFPPFREFVDPESMAGGQLNSSTVVPHRPVLQLSVDGWPRRNEVRRIWVPCPRFWRAGPLTFPRSRSDHFDIPF